jgi:GxxExxY protein
VELLTRSVPFRRQVPIAVNYEGHVVGQSQLDLLVREHLIVELKSIRLGVVASWRFLTERHWR